MDGRTTWSAGLKHQFPAKRIGGNPKLIISWLELRVIVAVKLGGMKCCMLLFRSTALR